MKRLRPLAAITRRPVIGVVLVFGLANSLACGTHVERRSVAGAGRDQTGLAGFGAEMSGLGGFGLGGAGGRDAGPTGGAGTPASAGQGAVTPGNPLGLPIDPAAFGHADLSHVTFAAFSQTNVNDSDPQVLGLAPDLVPRAWGQWDTLGTHASDYVCSYPAACRANGTLFVGGLTASVIFSDQMSDADFQDEVGRDAAGRPVPHDEVVPGAYRGALASPGFRQRLIDIAKLQIDCGVDGLFFDEVTSSYIGANYGGDEGFDAHDVADFGRFLCLKYRNASGALAAFDLQPSDGLDCDAADPGAGFDYLGYLARHGAQASPLGASNPLAALWGTTVPNRPNPAAGSFVESFPALVYFQELVVAARKYARDTYGKEILVTANGVFPFVDFQSVGLYDWNPDGNGPRGFDYVPLVGSDLDGTVSYLPALDGLKARSQGLATAVGGEAVPLLLFLDWPTDNMNRYYALPLEERKDYVRLFLAEAYADGVWFALPLATTTDANSASALGMLDFFEQIAAFYRAHADLLRGATPAPDTVAVDVGGTPAKNVAARLVSLPDGRSVLHLVNHDYDRAFVLQTLSLTLSRSAAPTSVTLASPDLGGDEPASFAYADGKLTLDGVALVSSLLVVVK